MSIIRPTGRRTPNPSEVPRRARKLPVGDDRAWGPVILGGMRTYEGYRRFKRTHTHQQHAQARAFCEKHGFRAVKFGISPPPESEPDVEYHWTPAG